MKPYILTLSSTVTYSCYKLTLKLRGMSLPLIFNQYPFHNYTPTSLNIYLKSPYHLKTWLITFFKLFRLLHKLYHLFIEFMPLKKRFCFAHYKDADHSNYRFVILICTPKLVLLITDKVIIYFVKVLPKMAM